jgi:hypothetical protein
MKIERIKFKNHKGTFEGYYTEIMHGKFAGICFTEAIVEFKPEDIIDRYEVEIGLTGNVSRKLKGGKHE